MTIYHNPFEPGSDRFALWQMAVERDIEAYLQSNWDLIKEDFLEADFSAIDARGSDNPDSWQLSFPSVAEYRDSWLASSREMVGKLSTDKLRQALLDATTLRDIQIAGNSAILHKKFDGQVVADDGSITILNWQTLYQCVKVDGQWKIAGFVGYLPNPMGTRRANAPTASAPTPKQLPASLAQLPAGTFSPALLVNPGQLVVISGQAAIDAEGAIVGTTIQEQTTLTLQNCEKQLAAAGCTFQDVFKVNAYMTNLAEWEEFNKIYRSVMPLPRPVRTTVGVQLLPGLLIEIEMWAVRL